MPQSLSAAFNKKHYSILTTLVCVVTVVLLGGCTTAAPKPAPQSASQAGLTKNDGFDNETHWVRNSAEYRAIFEQTYKAAGVRIQELAEGREPGTWAVSLDADETLVDNSIYQVEIASRGEVYSPESWHAWIERKAAPALPGAVEFTALVKSLGGIVAAVTNRRNHQCALTVENIIAVGISVDVTLCRVDDGEKEARYDALADGTTAQWPDVQFNGISGLPPLDVLMWLGDNIGDFPGLDQSVRDSEAPLSDFGDRFFMLPNPMYGSWEENPKE